MIKTFEQFNSDIDPLGEEIWIDIDYPKEFKNFLDSKNCKEKFINNMKLHPFKSVPDVDWGHLPIILELDDYLNSLWNYPQEYITLAFHWSETKEGLRYWLLLDCDWREKVRVFKGGSL